MKDFVLIGPDVPSQLEWTARDAPGLGGSSDWHVRKITFQAGLAAGVDVIEVDNGKLKVCLLPTRGMGIWKMESAGIRVGWDAPAEYPVHPMYVNLASRNGLGWLDGFNELLCRCGLSFNGPPGIDPDAASPIESEITLHGQIANRPAEWVKLIVTEQGLSIRGLTREVTLFGPNLALETEYFLPADRAELHLTDTVRNLAGRPAEMQLLYHINVGTPLLEAGSRWQAPCRAVYPRDPRAAEGLDTFQEFLGPTAGYAEQVYLCQLRGDEQQRTTALLTNAAASSGFALDFDLNTLPCFSVWKNTQLEADGYCTGLEPGTNFPNFKAIERKNGRVVSIPAGGMWSTRMTLSVLKSAGEVEQFQQRIAAIQHGETPVLQASQAELTRGLE
ncbi:MAG: aldose 1-epimerase family protein [Planctomycetaceae bacterium]|nr:aldose 1-epimerase family protein [Planctomycetaceae bacterium]